jgi:ElaB/YqjD/DUF883 family membrane-anchored ribosome-binding protein
MNGGMSEMEHIERDLGRTRARLDANIDTLQQKFAPGDLVDQAVNYFKEGGGMEFGRDLGRSVRANPLPIALIGVGLGWLMLSGKKQAGEAYGTSGGPGHGVGRSPWGLQAPHEEMPAYQAAAYEDLASKAHEAGAGVARRADETEDAFQERVHAAKAAVLGVTRDAGEAAAAFGQRVEDALTAAADRFRQLGSQASAMAGDAGRAATDQASDLLDRGREGVRSLQDQGRAAAEGVRGGAGYAITQTREVTARSVSYVQDQPLLLGALGIALGAGLGMLVPTSRHEREMLREASAGLREQAKGAVRELQAGASRVAHAAVGTAQDAARREGLPDMHPQGLAASARERVADTASRVRGAVEETAVAGREALERELSTKVADDKSGQTPDTEPKLPSTSDAADPVTLDNKVKPLPLP